MKVTAFIRQTSAKNNTSDQTHVYFRVRDGKTDIKASSELSINPNHWSAERQGYKSRVSLVTESKRVLFDKQVSELAALISQKYYRGADGDWLKNLIEEYHHPEINNRSRDKENLLVNRIAQYAKYHPMTRAARVKHECNLSKLKRFELYMKTARKRRGYALNVDTMTADDLRELQDYILHEHEYVETYPEIFKDLKSNCLPRPRSENTLNTIFRRLRTVINWCIKNKYTLNNPFDSFETPKDLYGPPFYLNLEERDKVYNADLSKCSKKMQVYRDIFIFQCLIGCRVGDLVLMTKDNVVNGAIEYIAEKTKIHNARTIRVPLNEKAKAILAKYEDVPNVLLPSFKPDEYNRYLTKILKHVGIDRKVPVLNLMTRETELKPLSEVATSHTARKTFIGNLYKKVKDPSLVASLSGHTDGSRAFARYREIDMDMKRELVEMID